MYLTDYTGMCNSPRVMDITVYLPDDLGAQAKAAGINLSRTLRDAITEELRMRDAVQSTLQSPTVFKLVIEGRDGSRYTGRITGSRIAAEDRHEVYLTDDERVIGYDSHNCEHWTIEDPQADLRSILGNEEYAAAMTALGITPVIDL